MERSKTERNGRARSIDNDIIWRDSSLWRRHATTVSEDGNDRGFIRVKYVYIGGYVGGRKKGNVMRRCGKGLRGLLFI